MDGEANTRLALWLVATLVAASVSVLLLVGCSRPASEDDATKRVELTLASYAVPGEAYATILPAFQEYWKQRTGQEVRFTESYGGSASQARAVIEGLDADVVNLAMEPDLVRIEDAGLIDSGWQARTENSGVVTTSLIVFGVRDGNPKNIRAWADVSSSGVGVVTPNPKTSGGAQWNLLASWGSVAMNGGSETDAYDRVRSLYANTLVLDKNARDATNTFLQKGIGDAALLWESDALIAKSAGADFDIVIPTDTIEAETVVAVVDDVVDRRGTREVAEAFVAFLFTESAQEAFAETGLRPVDPRVLEQYREKFPMASGRQFRISDFGGWSQASPKFFSDSGIYSRVEADVAKGRK